MASLNCFKRCFILNWPMAVLTILVSGLFIYLGMWQLNRAYEKKTMLSHHEILAKKSPINWQAGNIAPQQYQKITVHGSYLTQALLLDNQYYQHQFGYNVLTPLELANGTVVLIDRGWIKGNLNRQNLPELSLPKKTLQLTGQVYYPSPKNWVLGQLIEEKSSTIAIVEKIDTLKISKFLHKSVYPFIIRLDKKEEDGYIREWAIISMPASRHHAYAAQWFAMALVIWLIFIGLSVKKSYD